jgi:tRNA pseudouridine38-40 synthase
LAVGLPAATFWPVPTYLLRIAYEGTAYHGWQQQPNGPSVQAAIARALEAIACPGVHVEGAGRTDAGVHALGQCAHVRLPRPFAPERLRAALNTHLPQDIAVQEVREAPPDFHARFHARGKRYVYRVCIAPVRPAIGRNLFHWVRRPLDLEAMRQAAQCLRGRHDFASFATNSGHPRKRVTIRTLQRVHLLQRPHGFDLALQGDGFLYNMVRSIVGALIEVGLGNRPPAWLAEVLAAKRRSAAAATAPAAGLYLLRVLYNRDLSSAGVEPSRLDEALDGALDD